MIHGLLSRSRTHAKALPPPPMTPLNVVRAVCMMEVVVRKLPWVTVQMITLSLGARINATMVNLPPTSIHALKSH